MNALFSFASVPMVARRSEVVSQDEIRVRQLQSASSSAGARVTMKKRGTNPGLKANKLDKSWFQVAEVEGFQEGLNRIALETENRTAFSGNAIFVMKEGGEFYALDANCSHMKFPLITGKVQENCIKCPLHGSRFDIDTGEAKAWCTFPPDPLHQSVVPKIGGFNNGTATPKDIRTYPTKIVGGFVYVQVKDP
eukprot:tig00000551_g2025.t1